MSRIVANYCFVLPAWVGGANHSPELRAESFVGVARWWWRFLALGRFANDAQVASFWEAVLFGWHARPFGRKHASFRLNADGSKIPESWTDALSQWSGLHYLSAQGLGDRKPVKIDRFNVTVEISSPNKKHFSDWADEKKLPGTAFLRTRLEGKSWEEEWKTACKTLVDALALLGLLGGLGARSRRGFGSLAIQSLTTDDVELFPNGIYDLAGYKQAIENHLGEISQSTTEPPYTALSGLTSIDICATRTGPAHELMNEVGWAFQIYRSWGHSNNRGGHHHEFKSGQRQGVQRVAAGNAKASWYRREFADDYQNVYRGIDPVAFDNRSVFGLPHNYKGGKEIGWIKAGERPVKRKRRASPLLLHIHSLSNGEFAAVVMVAPAKFAPSGSDLSVSNLAGTRAVPESTNWALAKEFANFLKSPPLGADGGTNGGVVYGQYTPAPDEEGKVL